MMTKNRTKTRVLTFCILLFAFCMLLTACRKKCEQHEYDDCADVECNVCGDKRDSMHSWDAADCVTPKTCKVCGKTEGSELGHDWQSATCITAKTCKTCGTTEGLELGHDWQSATCITAKTCKTCGTTEGEPLGHTPAKDDGDCGTDVLCTVCGAVTTPARPEHIAHADDGDCTTPITCTECGWLIIPAQEHNFAGDLKTDADGHWQMCQNTNCKVAGTKEAHNEGSDGKCNVCGYVFKQLHPDGTSSLAMPNTFEQADSENDSIVNEYMYMVAETVTENGTEKIIYKYVPAIFTFHIQNTSNKEIILNSIKLRLLDNDGKIYPIASRDVSVMNGEGGNELVYSGTYDEICVTIGTTMQELESFVAYSLVLILPDDNAFEGKKIEVVIESAEKEFVVYSLNSSALADINPDNECNWVEGKEYTFRVSTHCYNGCSFAENGECTVCGSLCGHEIGADDNDCTTAVTCTICGHVFVAAKEHNYSDELSSIDTHHFYSCVNDGCDVYTGEEEHHGEDDGDCTTWVLCECGWLVTEANESHTPAEDDGDCTTAVYCVNCEQIAIPAKEAHVATINPSTCVSLGTCDECGTTLPGYDANVHASENHTYIDNGDGTYKKVHECGVTLEDAHTFNSECACGDKIVITHMTISGEGFTFDRSTNSYTGISTRDFDLYYYVFHGINLKYYTSENTLQMIRVNNDAWKFSAYNVAYDEDADTLSILGVWSKSEDFVIEYSNDGGITWEDGCLLSVRRLLGISTNDCKHGSVTANAYAIEGELVTLNIAADEGYQLKSLTVKDSENNDVAVENGQFTMPGSAVSVSATFVCEDGCAFTYIPNQDMATHRKVCPNCDYVEIESEAHPELEYYYVDNGDHTHTKIWKCCNESIVGEHVFNKGEPCVCGSAAIGITGITFIAHEEYIYDTATRTYTVIIPPDRDTANVTIQFVGNNLEYTSVENDNMRVIEVHKYGQDEYSLYDLIYNLDFVFEWINMEDGAWLEYMFSNDSGENWTKYRVEVKQSYSVSANEAQGGTVTVGEGKTHALAGDTVTLSATPDAGYLFDTWAVTDADGNPITVENGQFIMPASAVTVNAVFKVDD